MPPTSLSPAHRALLRCPVCRSPMTKADAHSVYCKRRHCFDVAKNGYINLLPHPVHTPYDRALFAARHAVLGSGFFAPLVDALTDILRQHAPVDSPRILDAGCGEGSVLADVGRSLGDSAVLAGFDLSKDAIRAAAAHHPGPLWCVADLTAMPFADAQFDAILCVLSPSNYAESKRCLKPGGVLIKVTPGGDYLCELRQALYAGQEKAEYSNQRVVDYFDSRFGLLETRTIRYDFPLDEALLPHLLRMTPLAWQASQSARDALLATGLPRVTIELSLMVGRRQGNAASK